MVGLDLFAALQRQAADSAALDTHVHHLLLEADLAAQGLDVGPHLLDHAHQAEGADVRLADVQDFLGRAGLDELGQHLARQVARVADLAPELAVAEGAGATLAELHVAGRIEHALAPEAPGVLGTLAHVLAALHHDGRQAHLRQHQRRKEAARAEAHDHGPQAAAGLEVGRRLGDGPVGGVGRRAHMRIAGVPRQHGRFIFEFAVDRVDQLHRRLSPRVVGATEDREAPQRTFRHAQAHQKRRSKCIVGVGQWQAEFGDAQHGRDPRQRFTESGQAGRWASAGAPKAESGGISRPSSGACPGSSCCACASHAPG